MVTGRERAVLGRHNSLCTAAVFSLDGGLLATASNDGVVRVWDLSTGGERCSFRAKAGVYSSLAFAPDGQTLAVGTEEAAEVWRTIGPRLLTSHGPRGCRLVAVAPDGLTMALNSTDAGFSCATEFSEDVRPGAQTEIMSTPRHLAYTRTARC